MIIYLALLVPLFITGIFYFYRKHEFVWWEFFIPIFSTLIVIGVSKLIIDHTSVMFTEYWGSSVTGVYEQEPYNYWQQQTCSYTTTDANGNSTTHYYDCSHQVDVGPSWWTRTNIDEKISIDEKLHDELVKQFSTSKSQVDSRKNHSSRSKASGSRGTKFEGTRVGNVSYTYKTKWGGEDHTRKPYSSKHSYENRIKASDLTVFNIQLVTEGKADSLGLFRYPEHKRSRLFGKTDGWKYPTILGVDVPDDIHEDYRRLNGKFGVSNELRLWILVFKNKPQNIAIYQENYWVKGNKNELVVCIGVDDDNNIQWSHSFSWALSNTLTAEVKNAVLDLYEYTITTTEGKILPVVMPLTKEMIGATGVDTSLLPPAFVLPLPQNQIQTVEKSEFPVLTDKTWERYYTYLNENLDRFERRSFEEFSYLKVMPSRTAIIIIFIFALIVSIGVNVWVTRNEYFE